MWNRGVLVAARAGAWLVGLAAVASVVRADDRDRRRDARGPDLRTASIRDGATRVSVPLTADESLVVGLPERFWIQCPRHSSVPTSLDGDGLVLQYLNARGGTHSLVYVGAVALVPARAGETPEARLERAASEFVGGLREKLRRVDFLLRDAHVATQRSTVVLGGKKVPAVSTARFVTPPAVPVSGPESTLSGECVLFAPEGRERLVYAAVASKAGGTSLDRVTADLSVRRTTEMAQEPRLVQLVDVANALDDRAYPVRLVSYGSPAGFAPTLDVVRITDETVYAEDRRDFSALVTGTLRVDHVDVDAATTLAAAAEDQRKAVSWGRPSAPVDVALATEGARAKVFRYEGDVGPRHYVARRAVALLDDKALVVTWSTFGDAALADRDAKAFDRMLASMQLAIRSKTE